MAPETDMWLHICSFVHRLAALNENVAAPVGGRHHSVCCHRSSTLPTLQVGANNIYNTLTLEGQSRVVGDPLGGAEVASFSFSAVLTVPPDRIHFIDDMYTRSQYEHDIIQYLYRGGTNTS